MADYSTKLLEYPDFLVLKRECFPPEKSDELKVFKVQLYVRQFRPEEISIKVIDSHLIVRGHLNEHVDLHGFVSREFKWKYPIPDEYDPRSTSTTLLPSGILKIFVYRKDQWTKFMSGKRRFKEYIDLRPFVFQNLSLKIEGGTIALNAAVKGRKDSKLGNFEIDEKYVLPSDIDPNSVIARLSHTQMLEISGRRLPTTKIRSG